MFRLRSSWVAVSVGRMQGRQSALKDPLGDHSRFRKNRLGESNEAKL